MRIKSFSFCILLSLMGTVKVAQACACVNQTLNDRQDAVREFASATEVFEGEVVPGGKILVAPILGKQVLKPGLRMIVFRVVRSYKGSHTEFIQVYDAQAGTDCEFGEPAKGEKFFVYGFSHKDGKVYLEACSRTASLKFAGPDLRYARKETPTIEDLKPPKYSDVERKN